MVLGVSDKPPRRVVGSLAFPAQTDLNRIKAYILRSCGFAWMSQSSRTQMAASSCLKCHHVQWGSRWNMRVRF